MFTRSGIANATTPARRSGETTPDAPTVTQEMSAHRVKASINYMLENLHKPVSVSALSAIAGLSNSSFFAHFKTATGRSPLDFFIRARMQHAAKLLEDGHLQIKEVAMNLGYEDPYYFSRLFKSVHGIPPRDYRSQAERSRNASPEFCSVTPEARRPSSASPALAVSFTQ